MIRKRVFEIIEKAEDQDKLSAAYDFGMIVVIVLSLIPLAFKTDSPFFFVVDKVCVVVLSEGSTNIRFVLQ